MTSDILAVCFRIVSCSKVLRVPLRTITGAGNLSGARSDEFGFHRYPASNLHPNQRFEGMHRTRAGAPNLM